MTTRISRPLGPWPVAKDGFTVLVPVVSQTVEGGIDFTMVDVIDYAVAMSRAWHVSHSGYVVANGTRDQVRLHGEIMRPSKGFVVDHVRGYRLDNRRNSLRVVTPSVNGANVRVRKMGRSSRFRGVTLHKQTGRWQAGARKQGRFYFAGLFDREEDAAAAYDRLAGQLWPGIVRPQVVT
jgi:hypothetical protein